MAAPTITFTYNIESGRAIGNLFVGDSTDLSAVSYFGWGVSPVSSASKQAMTQTYATADAEIAAVTNVAPTETANTVVLTGTNIAAKTASLTLIDAVNTNAGTVATSLDQAQKDLGTAINRVNTNLASTNVQLAALAADVLADKKNLNKVIDALQALGLLT